MQRARGQFAQTLERPPWFREEAARVRDPGQFFGRELLRDTLRLYVYVNHFARQARERDANTEASSFGATYVAIKKLRSERTIEQIPPRCFLASFFFVRCPKLVTYRVSRYIYSLYLSCCFFSFSFSVPPLSYHRHE